MASRPPSPLHLSWLLPEILGLLLLMAGLLAYNAPSASARLGIPAGAGWPLMIAGGIAMLIAQVLFFVRFRQARQP